MKRMRRWRDVWPVSPWCSCSSCWAGIRNIPPGASWTSWSGPGSGTWRKTSPLLPHRLWFGKHLIMPILLRLIILYRQFYWWYFITSDWWNDLVEQFHTGAFPDLLNNGTQLFIGLLKITWSMNLWFNGWVWTSFSLMYFRSAPPYNFHFKIACKFHKYLPIEITPQTFGFDFQCSSDQSEQRGIKCHGSITV